MVPDQTPDRNEIPEKYRWDLDLVYPSADDWMNDLERIRAGIPDVVAFKGHLKDDPSAMARCIRLLDELDRTMEKAYTYSHLRHDEDLKLTVNMEMHDRARSMAVSLSEASSFMVPEILTSSDEVLSGLIDLPELRFAKVLIRDILRDRDHYLDERSEMIVAMGSKTLGVPPKTFKMLNDADLSFGTVEDGEGVEHDLTHGKYSSYLMSRDRTLRKNSFERLMGTYGAFRNTFTSILDGEMEGRRFISRVRRFPSSLEASLNSDEVPLAVFENIIATVKEYLPQLHSYMGLRRDVLGLDELHMFDLYVPLVHDLDRTVTFEEAMGIVLSSLEPMGDGFTNIAKEFRVNRWIDVYENKGKRSGAYSSGSYDTPPYILMNYDGKVKDLFTLSHEMGHSIHSHIANRAQPHITADYPILLAEVASNMNEALLSHHLMGIWDTPKDLPYLLNHELEEMRTSVFRQCLFAEFEYKVSKLVEDEQPLTPDLLCDIYEGLNSEYYGKEVTLDPGIRMEWARIPHFYYDFYVYKYVTGYCCARYIANEVLSGREGIKDGYLAMLGSGGSLPPLEALRMAGIDLSTPGPVRTALSTFEKDLDILSKTLCG